MNLKLKRSPAIYVVGFMGSGKTTIGKRLADELGWHFFDIDDDIEAIAGMSIPNIFEEKGEAEFRRIESEAIAARVRQAEASKPMVVALGGGAYAREENARLVDNHGVTVWLDCPLQMVTARVAAAEHRPLARDPEAFERLYHARREAYAKAAFRIEVESDDAGETVNRILNTPGLL
jgi:shikimate kinase